MILVTSDLHYHQTNLPVREQRKIAEFTALNCQLSSCLSQTAFQLVIADMSPPPGVQSRMTFPSRISNHALQVNDFRFL